VPNSTKIEQSAAKLLTIWHIFVIITSPCDLHLCSIDLEFLS